MARERSWQQKLLRWALIIALALESIYLVGGNLILNTGILSPIINKRPEKTLVEWSGGSTFLPGRLHVKGLRVRGQSKGQQWEFEVAEADVRISLLALARKTIRISRVRGTSFDFRLRPRLTEETKDLPDAADFPDIAGLSNPPNPAPEDIYPPRKNRDKPGWHLDLSDVEFKGPMSLWVAGARMSGNGLVAADLDFLFRRQFHLSRAIFDLSDGEIALGDNPVVGDLEISADLTLGPFAPQEVKGLEVLDYLLGTSRLDNGEIKDLSVLNAYVPGAGSFELTKGHVSFSWSFDKPSVEEGSSGVLAISAQGAEMLIAGRQVAGDLDLRSNLVRGSLREGRWEVADTTLALDNMILEVVKSGDGAGAPEHDPEDLWWGHFTIETGSVDLGQPSSLAVEANFEIKDTRPLLEIFMAKPNETGEGAKVPRWLRLIPNVTNLGGTASLVLDADGAILDDVVIQGDKFDFLARLSSQGQESTGVLYVRYKALDFGLDMTGGKSDLKILRPKKWFLEQLGPEDTAMRAVLE